MDIEKDSDIFKYLKYHKPYGFQWYSAFDLTLIPPLKGVILHRSGLSRLGKAVTADYRTISQYQFTSTIIQNILYFQEKIFS